MHFSLTYPYVSNALLFVSTMSIEKTYIIYHTCIYNVYTYNYFMSLMHFSLTCPYVSNALLFDWFKGAADTLKDHLHIMKQLLQALSIVKANMNKEEFGRYSGGVLYCLENKCGTLRDHYNRYKKTNN